MALAIARRDLSTPGGAPPPSPLRPLLRFHGRLPPRALSTVQRVLDTDEDFRRRVVAEVDADAVDRATWLFLARPEGWREEFDVLAEARAEGVAREAADRSERSAARRADQLTDALERQRAELVRTTAAAEQARRDLEGERTARLRAEDERDALDRRVQDLLGEREVAVRQLAEARSLADARLARSRELAQELEAERAAPPPPAEEQQPPPPAAAPDGVAEAVRRASEAAAVLGAALDDAARALGPVAERSVPAGASPSDEPGRGIGRDTVPERPRRRRRMPVRLGRAAVEGSVEATDQVVRAPGVVVVVDGYNVSMQGWPALSAAAQRERLVALLGDLVSRTGAEVHVVFDGDDDGRRPAVSTPLRVRVHFTAAGVEADDVVLDMTDRLPVERSVAVVSSDRRVQDGARQRGANVVASEALLAWARR